MICIIKTPLFAKFCIKNGDHITKICNRRRCFISCFSDLSYPVGSTHKSLISHNALICQKQERYRKCR